MWCSLVSLMKPPGHAVAVLLFAVAAAGCVADKPLDPQAEAKRLEFCRSVIDAVKPGDPTCGPYLEQLRREKPQQAASPPALAPVPQPAASLPALAPVAGLSPDDARAYQSEIEGLQESAKNNNSFAKQYSEIGSSDTAVDRLREASAQLSTVTCLSNQRKRAVPFYEAKARCKAAEG